MPHPPSTTTKIAAGCVAFTKNTPLAKAMSLLSTLEYPHREGSHCARGRIYFDNTGPRFIVTVNRAELEQSITAVSAYPVIQESYEASLGILTD